MSKFTLASLFALGAGVLLMALTVVLVYIDQMFIAGMTGRPGRESLSADVFFFSSCALPAMSILGIILISCSPKGQRFGDYVAKTFVVGEKDFR